MKVAAVTLLLITNSCSVFAAPQDANLSDLERRLKQEQAAASKQQQQEALMATLIVKSTHDCDLKVNATPQGRLVAGESKLIRVSAGGQLVECFGSSGASAETTTTVAAGQQSVVTLAIGTTAAAIPEGLAPFLGVWSQGSIIYESKYVGDGRVEWVFINPRVGSSARVGMVFGRFKFDGTGLRGTRTGYFRAPTCPPLQFESYVVARGDRVQEYGKSASCEDYEIYDLRSYTYEHNRP